MTGAGLDAMGRLLRALESTERLLGIRKFHGLRSLARMAGPDEIPFLIKKLFFRNKAAVSNAARELRLATAQDFGTDAVAWQGWFEKHKVEKRDQWVQSRLEAEGYPLSRFAGTAGIPILLEALKDQSEEIRLHAYLLFLRIAAPKTGTLGIYYPSHGSIAARRRALTKLMRWWHAHRKDFAAQNSQIAEAQKIAREIAVDHPLAHPESRKDFSSEQWRKWEKDVADRYDMLVKKTRGPRVGLLAIIVTVLTMFILMFFCLLYDEGFFSWQEFFFSMLGIILPLGGIFAVGALIGAVATRRQNAAVRRVVRAYSTAPECHRELHRKRRIQEVLEGKREFGLAFAAGLTFVCIAVGLFAAAIICDLPFQVARSGGLAVLYGAGIGLVCGILLSIYLSLPRKRREK